MRWGIISAAKIAYDEFVPAIRRSDHSTVYAIASHSPDKVEKFEIAKRFNTYEGLVEDPQVEAVYIPLPNSLHHQMVIQAMQAGKHVLVEKPATISLREMQEISEVTQKTGKIFLEGFMYQYHLQHTVMKRLLPRIGKILHIKAHFSDFQLDTTNFRFLDDFGGGAMHDVGGYCMHVITQLIGFKPQHISSVSKHLPDSAVDLTTVCTMIDQKGVIATFTSSMEMPFLDYYEITGANGVIVVKNSFRPDLAPDGHGNVSLYNHAGQLLEQHHIKDDQYANEINFFEKLLDNPKLQLLQLQQSEQMANYMEKSYQSAAENGRLIKVDGDHHD